MTVAGGLQGTSWQLPPAQSKDVDLLSAEGLRWYRPVPEVAYGFCVICGSTLFWRVEGSSTWSIAARDFGPTDWVAHNDRLVHQRSLDYHKLDTSFSQRNTE